MSVIRVENVGKRYRVGELEAGGMLRDKLASALRNPASLLRRTPRDEFWALRDISFEVKEGEVLGLIGRNGAGKSTLLKVLSRITAPTVGEAVIRGRCGSLLEVGTGFHPELTGRENVFLNGAILGMGKREIARKFDEIVAFAEVERFIDTPVKRYSSGMYVRLAFAVAAHLDTDILFVDEVLSVGDAQFQKKCLGKMGDVARYGRTIVFISHQMNQVRRLCHRVIWLDGGMIRESGLLAHVLGAYESVTMSRTNNNGRHGAALGSNDKARFVTWEVLEPRCETPHVYDSLGTLKVQFILQVDRQIRSGVHGIALYSADGQVIWGAARDNLQLDVGTYAFVYLLPGLPVRPGVFAWRVSLYEDGVVVDDWECLPNLVVSTRPLSHPSDEWSGMLNVPCEFSLQSYDR